MRADVVHGRINGVDTAAAIAMPVALRRQNFITPDMFPYQTPVAVVDDTGNDLATTDKLLEILDHAGLAARAGLY